MSLPGPGEPLEMPRIGRPRLTPRQRACAIGVTLVVLAILVTAVVAPVNGDWWWVQRTAFILGGCPYVVCQAVVVSGWAGWGL